MKDTLGTSALLESRIPTKVKGGCDRIQSGSIYFNFSSERKDKRKGIGKGEEEKKRERDENEEILNRAIRIFILLFAQFLEEINVDEEIRTFINEHV